MAKVIIPLSPWAMLDLGASGKSSRKQREPEPRGSLRRNGEFHSFVCQLDSPESSPRPLAVEAGRNGGAETALSLRMCAFLRTALDGGILGKARDGQLSAHSDEVADSERGVFVGLPGVEVWNRS